MKDEVDLVESSIHLAEHPTVQRRVDNVPYVLVERSAGGVLRAVSRLYFGYFWTINMIFALPVVPFTVVATWADHGGHMILRVLSLAPSLLLGPFVAGALTIAVADIRLGRPPSVINSYRRTSQKLWAQLLATNLLSTMVIGFGMLLFVVPGILFFTWYLLVPSVVVLEGIWGGAALQRSKALVQGYFWHTLGIVTGLTTVTFTSGYALGAMGLYMDIPKLPLDLIVRMLDLGGQAFIILSTVLIYYDLRVRKEAYDSQTLASDLMH